VKWLRRLVVLVLFGGTLWLAVQFPKANAELVRVDLLAFQAPEVELWLVLLVSFSVGALLAALLLVYEVAKLGLLTRRYRKTVVGLESEIHELRNLPLDEPVPSGQVASLEAPGESA